MQHLLWQFHESGKLVACICAGSLAAKAAGVNLGGRITSHPSVRFFLFCLFFHLCTDALRAPYRSREISRSTTSTQKSVFASTETWSLRSSLFSCLPSLFHLDSPSHSNSRGPGTSIEHCLKIIEILAGEKKRNEVAEPLCL